MSYRVHITRPLPQIAVDLLKEAGYQVSVPNDDGLPSRDDMLESIKDAQGVLSILTEKIDEEVLEAANNDDLKPIQNLLRILEKPYEDKKKINEYQSPAPSNNKVYKTFCGT